MLQYRYKTLVQAYDMSCLQNINLPQLQLNLSLFCILLSQTKPCLCTIHINVLILTGVIGIGLTVCTVFCVPVVLVLGQATWVGLSFVRCQDTGQVGRQTYPYPGLHTRHSVLSFEIPRKLCLYPFQLLSLFVLHRLREPS